MSKSKNKKWTVEQHSRQLYFFITLMVNEEVKVKAEELLAYAKEEPSTEKFKEIWTLVDGAAKLPTEAMCPECHTRLRKLKLNGKDRWPLCAACHWKKVNTVVQKPVDCDGLAPRRGFAEVYPEAVPQMPVLNIVAFELDAPEIVLENPQARNRRETRSKIEAAKKRTPRKTGKTARKKMAARRHQEE